MRVEINITGYNKSNAVTGKATRILAAARSTDFLLDNVDQVKGSIKVGQCGRHEITVRDETRTVKRVDMGRRGSKAAEIGVFAQVK